MFIFFCAVDVIGYRVYIYIRLRVRSDKMKFCVLVELNGKREWVNGMTARSREEAMRSAEVFVKGSKAVSAFKQR